jgi:hypothetical protein
VDSGKIAQVFTMEKMELRALISKCKVSTYIDFTYLVKKIHLYYFKLYLGNKYPNVNVANILIYVDLLAKILFLFSIFMAQFQN